MYFLAALGVVFDEIVVDTSLVVKRKNPNRQSKGISEAKLVPVKKPELN